MGATASVETIASADSGILVKRAAISKETLMDVRREVIETIYVADGEKPDPAKIAADVNNFKSRSATLMRDLLKRKPYLRRVLPVNFRNLPSVRRLASESALLKTLKEQGLVAPIELSVSVQLWLPWEKIFHEKIHQDIGGLISENSWTIQVPLHDVTRETGAVEVFPGTYKLGVLPLEWIQDSSNGYFYETSGEKHIKNQQSVITDVAMGDAFFFRCLNLHKTSQYQDEIRWSIVIRYDDLWKCKMLENGKNPYATVVRNYDFKLWTDQLEKFLSNYKVGG